MPVPALSKYHSGLSQGTIFTDIYKCMLYSESIIEESRAGHALHRCSAVHPLGKDNLGLSRATFMLHRCSKGKEKEFGCPSQLCCRHGVQGKRDRRRKRKGGAARLHVDSIIVGTEGLQALGSG